MSDFWFYASDARGGTNTDENALLNFQEYLDAIPVEGGTTRALVPGSWPDLPQFKRGVDVAWTKEVRMVGVTGILYLLRITRDIAERDRIDDPDAMKPSDVSEWAKWITENIVPQNAHMQQVRLVGDPPVETVIREKLAEPVYGVSNKVGLIDRFVEDFLEGPIRFL